MYFLLKIKTKGKMVSKCQTHSIRRFKKYLRTINWKESDLKVYLKVGYGFHLDNFRKMSIFANEGEYDNPDDLCLAFDAFIENN